MSRTLLLASDDRLATAEEVWKLRALFGSDPEVHLVSQGRFLTASEAAARVPWAAAGLDYSGTFFDALSERRVDQVLPLLSHSDGAIQGLLEFEDVPYAGCGMTAAILARDDDHCRAVLESLDLPRLEGPAAAVAVIGNDELLTGIASGSDPEAEAFAGRVYHGLGAGGWALVEVVRTGSRLGWKSVKVQPDLHPQGAFVSALAPQGFTLRSVLEKVLRWGRSRHDAEVGLKNHFKDKV